MKPHICIWPGCTRDWVADKLLPAHPVMARMMYRFGGRSCCNEHTDLYLDTPSPVVWRELIAIKDCPSARAGAGRKKIKTA